MKKNSMILFFLVLVLFNLAASFAHPVTPAFIVERQLDSSMFGTALAAMMFMSFLFSPFWGKLSDYVPTRNIMMISSIGYALGQVFFLFAQNETSVMIGRMFAGIFVGGAFTSFSNYIINTAKDARERDRNLTTYVTIQTVGSACGYFIGGMLGLISTEAAFIAMILVLAVCGILFLAVCVDDTPMKHRPEKALKIRDVNPFSAFIAAKSYMTLNLVLIFAIIAISSIGQNSYEQCFNYFIKDQYNMSSAYNGTFKALIAFATLLLNSTVCITLQKKTDINRSFLWILLACCALTSIILIFRSRYLFIGIYILYSSVNVIRLPLLQSMVASRSTAESRGSMMGLNQAMYSLGGIFGALFAGLIYKMGAMLPFILAFAAYVISSIIGVVYIGRYKRESAQKTVNVQ